MTFLTVKTCRKSAPFRVGYLRAGGPVPTITAGPSLPPASFTPSVIPIPCGLATMDWHGTGGVYHVPLDRRCGALSGFLSPDRATNDEVVIRQHHPLTVYLLVTALSNHR
jgi:hypothetical protein